MTKYAPEFTAADQAMPDQLPELDVPALLKTQPQPRAFHFTDSNGNGVLPEGEGCGAAGPGGVGKSTVMLQLCVALATGQLWMGEFKPSYRVPVFFFTKEDSRDELHRRLWAITGEAMSAAVNACDKIRLHTTGECTTLLVHHSSKESARNQDATAGAFRGATDLVDGLRWTMALTKLSPKDRSQLPDGNNWRRITMPKTNYTEANDDGVLVESGPLTFRELRDRCHKDNGPVYAATRGVENVINTGMQMNLIRATKVTRANRQSYEPWEAREDAPEM